MPKQAISLRVDIDILEWFKSGGPGYQTRMVAVLRSHVETECMKQVGQLPGLPLPGLASR